MFNDVQSIDLAVFRCFFAKTCCLTSEIRLGHAGGHPRTPHLQRQIRGAGLLLSDPFPWVRAFMFCLAAYYISSFNSLSMIYKVLLFFQHILGCEKVVDFLPHWRVPRFPLVVDRKSRKFRFFKQKSHSPPITPILPSDKLTVCY